MGMTVVIVDMAGRRRFAELCPAKWKGIMSLGELLWEYDQKVPESVDAAGRPLIGRGSRGIAWWNGKVYTITNHGHLIAIDAKTGKPALE